MRDAAAAARSVRRSRGGGAPDARKQSKLLRLQARTTSDAIAYGRTDEARTALADGRVPRPNDAAFAQTLFALGVGPTRYYRAKLRAAIAAAPENEASISLIARQDVDGYNADIQSRGAILEAYYFANLYSSKPAWRAMLRDPRVKAMLMRYPFRFTGVKKAGPPDACRLKKRISNAGWIRRAENEMSFFDQTEKRKLVQWVVAYVAASFALLQGIDIVAQRFDWPPQTFRLVILAMIVGFSSLWCWPGIMENAARSG